GQEPLKFYAGDVRILILPKDFNAFLQAMTPAHRAIVDLSMGTQYKGQRFINIDGEALRGLLNVFRYGQTPDRDEPALRRIVGLADALGIKMAAHVANHGFAT